MAYSEMDYMNIGGGRTPIKIASVTSTSGQTIVDVLTALKNNAGSKLTQALNENWNTLCLKFTTSYGVVYEYRITTYIPTINVFFTNMHINSAGSSIYTRNIVIDLTSSNAHKLCEATTSNSGTTFNNVTTASAGTWELYV